MNDFSNVVKFPRRPNKVGQLFIWPCEIDGGAWCIYLEPPDEHARLIGARIDFNAAVEVARAYAAKTGAELVEDDGESGR